MEHDYSEMKDLIKCVDGDRVYYIPRNIFLRVLLEKKNTQNRLFVRYSTGAALFDMSERMFREIAEDAGAVYKPGSRLSLVKLSVMEEYMEGFIFK